MNSLEGPSMTILQESHGAVLEVHDNYMKYIDQGLVEVLVRRCCEGPDEILSEVLAWSCAGPYDKILRRSCWHPQRGLAPVLLRRSSGDPGEVLCTVRGFVHDLVQVLVRRTCGDPGKILSKRSLREDLADATYERCLYERSSGMLLGGSSIKILQDPLRQQQVLLWRPCGILLGALAWRSWSWFFNVFYNSFWEALVVEILVASFKRLSGPYVISCRSLWEDVVQTCVTRKILKMLWIGACMKVLFGMFKGSSCMNILWDPLCSRSWCGVLVWGPDE